MKHSVYSDINKQVMLKNPDAFLPLALREVSLILAPSMERTCRLGLLAATATKCNNWERDSNCQQKMQHSVSKKRVQDIQKNLRQIKVVKVNPDYGPIISLVFLT